MNLPLLHEQCPERERGREKQTERQRDRERERERERELEKYKEWTIGINKSFKFSFFFSNEKVLKCW